MTKPTTRYGQLRSKAGQPSNDLDRMKFTDHMHANYGPLLELSRAVVEARDLHNLAVNNGDTAGTIRAQQRLGLATRDLAEWWKANEGVKQ